LTRRRGRKRLAGRHANRRLAGSILVLRLLGGGTLRRILGAGSLWTIWLWLALSRGLLGILHLLRGPSLHRISLLRGRSSTFAGHAH